MLSGKILARTFGRMAVNDSDVMVAVGLGFAHTGMSITTFSQFTVTLKMLLGPGRI